MLAASQLLQPTAGAEHETLSGIPLKNGLHQQQKKGALKKNAKKLETFLDSNLEQLQQLLVQAEMVARDR